MCLPDRRSLPVGIVALLVLLVVVVAYVADWGTSVVLRDADGRELARSPLPASGDFEIEYVHSYYDVPALERFSAEPQGGFELVGISSPSEAVLDYYELEGRKSAEGTWMSLTIHEPRRFEALPLVGTETGQKTLVVSGERLPLYADRAPIHLTVRVEKDSFPTELREALSGKLPGVQAARSELIADRSN